MKDERKDWCKLPYALMLNERLTAADAVLYAALLDVSNEMVVNKTISGISELTGLSPKTIQRSLQRLKENGYIISAKSTGRTIRIKLVQVIPEKNEQEQKPKRKRKPEPEPEENPEHVEEALQSVLSKKMKGKSEKAVAEKYEELRAQASARVTDESKTLAYLSKMISNYQDKPDNNNGFDADEYECFLNRFD